MNYEIDDLDRQILTALLKDARTPFLEIARNASVAGATVHQRVDRMRDAGIIKGSKLVLNPEALGLGCQVLIGVHLISGKKLAAVLKKLEKLPEILDAYYTSGSYSLILRVITPDIKGFHRFLIEQLQDIAEIRETESFICLDHPIHRDVQLSEP